MADSGRCANDHCQCVLATAADYCSEYCSAVHRSEPLDGACACGHEGCVRMPGRGVEGRSVQTAIGPR